MQQQFLCDKYSALEELQGALGTLPAYITSNIKHQWRPYQTKALQRFIHYHAQYPNKTGNHLLFEMATGTGKTLVMACLMLQIYQQGYRNFIFFVNSTNILEKTKQNFIQPSSSKYLFTDAVEIDNKRVEIRAIDFLNDANSEAINILFITVQGLHSRMQNPKENSFVLDDFKDHKVVLLADEAHHLNTSTKAKAELDLEASWEQTVQAIYAQNKDNHLIELTATAEMSQSTVAEKYRDAIIIRYNLMQFKQDGYAKNIAVARLQSDEVKDKLLFAALINQYRQELAASHKLQIKPILLYKSKTIAASKDNHQAFIDYLQNITADDIDTLLALADRHKDVTICKNMCAFFSSSALSASHICARMKVAFAPEKIINANEDKDVTTVQLQLNSLEDADNRVRVVFAVDKLNEGWDVLNLYDIVKLFETTSGKGKPATTKEIQLIGRGARLYPFVLAGSAYAQEMFKRKFDDDCGNPLAALETLHFHSTDGSQYIDALNEGLIEQGLLEADNKEVSIDLKDDFRKSNIYQHGMVYLNTRENKTHKRGQGEILSTAQQTEQLPHISGSHRTSAQVRVDDIDKASEAGAHEGVNYLTLTLADIPTQIFKKALAQSRFFYFDRLEHAFACTSSTALQARFATSTLTLHYSKKQTPEQAKTPENLLALCQDFLANLKDYLTEQQSDYYGSQFQAHGIRKIIKNKTIVVKKDTDPHTGKDYPSFAQSVFVGDSAYEQDLIQEIDNYFRHQQGYSEAWLIRNHKHFTIYNKKSEGFEPDFLLMAQAEGNNIQYQIFVELKGEHLQAKDQWKADLMNALASSNQQPQLIRSYEHLFKNSNRRILAVPFYMPNDQDTFFQALTKQLSNTGNTE